MAYLHRRATSRLYPPELSVCFKARGIPFQWCGRTGKRHDWNCVPRVLKKLLNAKVTSTLADRRPQHLPLLCPQHLHDIIARQLAAQHRRRRARGEGVGDAGAEAPPPASSSSSYA